MIMALLAGVMTAGTVCAQDRPGMPDPGEGYAMLNEGNSLMGQMHTNVQREGKRVGKAIIVWMARQWGYPEHYSEGVGAAGIPIDWAWDTREKRQEFYEKRDSRDWDVFTVQPFGFQNRRDPETEAAGAAQFYRAMLEKNPDIPLLVYQTWPSGRNSGGAHFPDMGVALEDGGGDAEKYAKGLRLAVDAQMNPIAHILRQEFPDKPVYIMPVPQVFLALHEKLKSEGEFGGIKHMSELLDDGGRSVHVSRKGQWLTAMTQLASIYAQNPAEGKNIPEDYETAFAFALKEGMRKPGLSPEQADELAQLAWEVVSGYPATAASRKPFAFEDMTAPKPAKLTTSEVSGVRQATLAWEPGSDDTEVLKQAVYVNGDLYTTLPPEATSQEITNLEPGKANRVVVRTFDPTYNLADAVVELDVPAIEGELLAGWDLSTYTSNPDRVGGKQEMKLSESVETSTLTDALAGPMPITRGPGLDLTGINWGIFNLGDAKAATIEEAVASDDYFSFTVKPDDGNTLALSALTLPVRFHQNTVGTTQLALFSSATGFEADKAIETVTPPQSAVEIGFDLSKIDALQNVSKPVEIRVYITKIDQGMLGDPSNNLPEPDIKLYGAAK